ncbi:MAG: serine hydrolase domain-containing protein [Gemmatimonadaceae bacterium]
MHQSRPLIATLFMLSIAARAIVCQPVRPDPVAELKAHVERLAQADSFSGAVLIAKDGKTLWSAAYGIADKNFNVPNKVDTKFNLGSMNKMVTAVAIAQLVERGVLSFDDPVSKWVPGGLKGDAGDKVRIKHLLSHTSGLGSYFVDEWDTASRARFRSVDDFMTFANKEELQFEPGTRWAYNNTGMLVAGKVIEAATKQSYFDYVREEHLQAGRDDQYRCVRAGLRNRTLLWVISARTRGRGRAGAITSSCMS